MEFDFKICRSCGVKFQGENDVCDRCLNDFELLENMLKSTVDSKLILHCIYCGRPFKKSGTRTYCKGIHNDKIHYRQCSVCGEGFPVDVQANDKKTCSKECRKISFASSGKGKFKPIHPKVCKYCGKEFQPESSRQIYCKGPHYSTCVICGKEFEVNLLLGIPNTCSEECKQELICQTNENLYGARCYFQTERFTEQRIATCQEKWGVDHYSQTDDYRTQFESTMVERHGAANPQQCKAIKAQTRQTNIDKYGGPSPLCSPKVLETLKSNNRQKCGYDWQNQSPKGRKQISDKLIERRSQLIEDPVKRKSYLEYKFDRKAYLESLGTKVSTAQLAAMLGYTDISTIQADIQEYGLYEFINSHLTLMESEIYVFLKSIREDIQIIIHDRQEISPNEIDLYLPEYNIGIECNPTITHNSTYTLNMYLSDGDPTQKPLKSNYHQMKTDTCENAGIFLFHVFGYEWAYKRNVIESMLRNLISRSSNRYYGRNLNVVTVSNHDAQAFLEANHRQGGSPCSVRLGLQDSDGNLVSLMTFCRTRNGISYTESDTDDSWELVRFCNKLNTSVVGGASKLFKHFISHYQYDHIVSFSDRAHTRGDLYKVLGFSKISKSSPGYMWVHLNNDNIYYHRNSCQKQHLRSLLGDDSIDLSLTEEQIMAERGFVQVFDSGIIRWEYVNPSVY